MRLAYYLYSGWQVFVRWLYSALSIYSLTWTPCVRPNLAQSSGIQLGCIPALLRFAYCIPARLEGVGSKSVGTARPLSTLLL